MIPIAAKLLVFMLSHFHGLRLVSLNPAFACEASVAARGRTAEREAVSITAYNSELLWVDHPKVEDSAPYADTPNLVSFYALF